MSNVSISTEAIHAAILTKFKTATLTANLIYPGYLPDTSDMTEWIELCFDRVQRKPQRKSSKEVKSVHFVINCVVRQDYLNAQNKRENYRCSKLRAHVSSLFRHATLSIVDYSQVGNPEVGKLMVYEPKVGVLSGRSRQELSGGTQVATVGFEACAHET